jgi:hypothetical protein
VNPKYTPDAFLLFGGLLANIGTAAGKLILPSRSNQVSR